MSTNVTTSPCHLQLTLYILKQYSQYDDHKKEHVHLKILMLHHDVYHAPTNWKILWCMAVKANLNHVIVMAIMTLGKKFKKSLKCTENLSPIMDHAKLLG